MKPRRRFLLALGLFCAAAAWMHDKAPPRAPAPQAALADAEIAVPAAPPPPAPRPIVPTAPPDLDPAGALSPALARDLYHYNDLKKAVLFPDDLDRMTAETFAGRQMLTLAARFLAQSSQANAYSSEDEDMRMTLVDYIGDAALGRFSYEDRAEASRLLRALLEKPLALDGKESRQAKSLIGDRIDLMASYTQLDRDEARAFLDRHRGEPLHQHLLVGYSNGLYRLGLPNDEIAAGVAEAR